MGFGCLVQIVDCKDGLLDYFVVSLIEFQRLEGEEEISGLTLLPPPYFGPLVYLVNLNVNILRIFNAVLFNKFALLSSIINLIIFDQILREVSLLKGNKNSGLPKHGK